jgi:hypothetical protein
VRRIPTEKQYRRLLMLGSGAAWMSASKRDCQPLLRRGWVTADFDGRLYQWVRITPSGLRALADAVEAYGLPQFDLERAA